MKKTTTSHNGQKEREADAGDTSQAYGQAGPAPVAGVVDTVPFTTVCWELEVFLPIDLTLRYFRRFSV